MTPDSPWLDVEGYAGPLDHLVEQARARRLNLAALPLRELIGQLAQAIEDGLAQRRLTEPGDWLILACTLVQLRSALLLPEAEPQRQAAERTAETLRRRVLARAHLADAAYRFDRRPRLGRDTFARPGHVGPHVGGRPTGLPDLLDAAVVLLRQRARRQAPANAAVGRSRVPFWTINEAIGHLRGMLTDADPRFVTLDQVVEGSSLHGNRRQDQLGRRGAYAAGLMAALEICRVNDATLHQADAWDAIAVVSVAKKQQRLPLNTQ